MKKLEVEKRGKLDVGLIVAIARQNVPNGTNNNNAEWRAHITSLGAGVNTHILHMCKAAGSNYWRHQ